MELHQRKCSACDGDEPKLQPDEADEYLKKVPSWRREGDWIHRDLRFKDFKTAVDFVRDVADIAEDEGHHPDLLLHGYKHLRISLQTHAVGGLTENDFILAAKVERLHASQYA